MANPLSSSTREAAKVLYLQGEATVKIADAVGVKPATISQWVHRHKWTILRQSVAAIADKVVSQRVNIALQAQGDRTRALLADELESAAKTFAAAPASTVDQLLSSDKAQSRVSGVKTLVEAASTIHGWKDVSSTHGIASLSRFDEVIDVESTTYNKSCLDAPPTEDGNKSQDV